MYRFMQQQESNKISKGEGFGLLFWFVDAHFTTLSVYMRRGFGREALGYNSLAGFGMMAAWMAYTHDTMMYVLILGWFCAQLMQRFRTWRMLAKGIPIHSKYAGFPYWAMKMPFVRSEQTARWFVEPAMCFLGGAVIANVCPSIGLYVMAGAVTCIIRTAIEQGIEQRRVDAMRDAQIEGQYYGEKIQK